MAEDIVKLSSQVANLLDQIADEFELADPDNEGVLEVLEVLSTMDKEPEEEADSPKEVAERVYNSFRCHDFNTNYLAQIALKWLGPKKEDKPKQTKRKPGRPRKTTK